MKIFVRLQHYIILSIVLLLIAISSSFAVTMDVTVGFGGVAMSQVWTPITVQLSNPSDDNIKADLNISQPGNDNLVLCTSSVNLPAHSRKKIYHIYARLASYEDLAVSLTRGRSLYAIKKIKINAISPDYTLVVSAGDKAVRMNSIMGETVKRPEIWHPYNQGSGPVDSSITAAVMKTSEMPDRPSGYNGVNMLVLNGLTPSSTDSKVLNTINMCVASGGTLVIPTGPDYKSFQNKFYNELLPVNITGAVNLSGLNCLSATSHQAFPSGPVTVAMSTVKPGVGRVILAEGDVPIVVERDYGAGRVIFLAFDNASSPFKDWDGQVSFWKGILTDGYRSPAVKSTAGIMQDMNNYNGAYGFDPDILDNWKSLVSVILQSHSVRVPSFNAIGLFLLAYLIFLVPVNYIVLKRRRKLEFAWVTTPIIVIIFSLGAYAIGYTMKGGQLKLMEATVIETSSGNRYARMITDASIFSPARRSYKVDYSGENSIGEVLATTKEPIPPAFIGEKSSIDGVSMPMWSSKLLECEGGMDLGGSIDANLEVKNNLLRGKLRNNTNLTFADAGIVFGNDVMNIGNLSKSDEAEVYIQYIPVKGNNFSYYASEGKVTERLREYVISRAQSVGGPVLVARVVGTSNVFDLPDNRANIDSATYIFCRLDVSKGNVRNEVGPLAQGRQVLSSSGASTNPKTSDGYFTATFHTSGDVRAKFNIVRTSNTIKFKVVGSVSPPPGQSIKLSIYNFSNSQWEKIKIGEELSIMSDCVGPGNEVRIRMESSGPTPADAVKVGIVVINS